MKAKTGKQREDVVIIGGGVIGSAIAYFLAADPDFDGSVLVLERDASYATASTSLSAGGFRQQFSVETNIRISCFTQRFFEHLECLAIEGQVPELSLVRAGYLFLATARGLPILQQNYSSQRDLGVDVAWLETEELASRFPWLKVTDLAAGSLGRNEGWLDPYSLLCAFKNKARSLGVIYREAEVVNLSLAAGKTTRLQLADGEFLAASCVVNAAGPRADQVAAMAGISLPVRPRKRFVYSFSAEDEVIDMPMLIDPSGVYVRPEGPLFLCGVSPAADQDPDCLDFEVDPHLFEETIWPLLANRVPAFERIRPGRAWAGHYAYNTVDQNAVLGPHPEITNFYFANGFSGHGLQQSPAVGRGLAELIVHGTYQTLDLSDFSFSRFAQGHCLREHNVI